MARLTEVDVDNLSLVSKGANKQPISIYKEDIAEEKNSEADKFFAMVKSFFTKDKVSKSTVKGFNDRISQYELSDSVWNAYDVLTDVIYDIIYDDSLTNANELLTQAIDDHANYLKSKLSSNIAKEFFKKQEEDDEMKKEDLELISGAIAKALEPVTERLDKMEGLSEGEETNVEKEDAAEDIAQVITEAINKSLEPVVERIDKIEKARGLSKQITEEENEEEEINKSDSVFAGLL